jgi:N6-L-threonylcarbamoyladenine synthase
VKILGIETSCDESAAGVVEDGVRLLSSVVASQVDVHAPYGGVVPELASREHEVNLVPVVEEALEPVGGLAGVDALAVTYGPGLQGSLLVGMTFAGAAAYAAGLPIYGVNHLEGHLAALRLMEGPPDLPFVALLATGGHTALYDVAAWGEYRLLGETSDDAAGEAFDKVARLLGLPYPGGPPLEREAARGEATFDFPRPVLHRGLEFSYAGLKTAVAVKVKELGSEETARRRPDLAASFQEAALEVLAVKGRRACRELGRERLAVVGGVAANRRLGELLAAEGGPAIFSPPAGLCGDNGAMVAAAGFLARERGEALDVAAGPEPSLVLG